MLGPPEAYGPALKEETSKWTHNRFKRVVIRVMDKEAVCYVRVEGFIDSQYCCPIQGTSYRHIFFDVHVYIQIIIKVKTTRVFFRKICLYLR